MMIKMHMLGAEYQIFEPVLYSHQALHQSALMVIVNNADRGGDILALDPLLLHQYVSDKVLYTL